MPGNEDIKSLTFENWVNNSVDQIKRNYAEIVKVNRSVEGFNRLGILLYKEIEYLYTYRECPRMTYHSSQCDTRICHYCKFTISCSCVF